jgi:hypothetical protein
MADPTARPALDSNGNAPESSRVAPLLIDVVNDMNLIGSESLVADRMRDVLEADTSSPDRLDLDDLLEARSK